MWDAIREFLGAVVSFFYGLIPNLGVAIILLTVAVGTVLFPLTLKQTRSMRAMQLLQPELKRLQKEYAGDKPGLQQATLALYKERGVNPAAGCLPLLLQMPIWFALFQVLQSFSASPAVLNDECANRQLQVAPGTELAASEQTCAFSGFVPGGTADAINRVTATITSSSLAEPVKRTDVAVVGQGEDMPLVTVTVRPDTGVVPQGGAVAGFVVDVVNAGTEPVTLVELSSDVFADLRAADNAAVSDNTCIEANGVIPAGDSLACFFRGEVEGGAAPSQITVTAVVRDSAGRTASRQDTAQVAVSEALALVTVTVRPQSGAVPAEGGLVRFVVTVSNRGSEAVTVTGLSDSVYLSLTAPGNSPTRFLTMVSNGRLHDDIQAWLEAGRQPEDPAWRDFAWMNLSISPQKAFARGFVAFLPYVLLLLLVMGTAYWQQAQTTAKASPDQPKPPGQAILKFFPVLFGFISYTLPAGLAVYFAASSIFRIGQQSLIIRLGDRKAAQQPKSEPAEAVAELPQAKAPERPARASAGQPKGGTPAATTRSPQASQSRGKKRRRR